MACKGGGGGGGGALLSKRKGGRKERGREGRCVCEDILLDLFPLSHCGFILGIAI